MSTYSHYLGKDELQQGQQTSAYPTRASMIPFTPTVYTASPPPSGRRRVLVFTLIALAILLLIGAILSALYLFAGNKPTTSAKPIVGSVFFASSGQLGPNNTQGINDQLQIDLRGVPAPAAGKNYYGWLLSDTRDSETTAILLGALPMSKGIIHTTYPGDTHHTNLLEHYSQFLITEESTDTPPVNPSPDHSTWRYYALIPQTPNPADPNQASMLDHLRYLLSSDPVLEAQNLHGGLDIWLLKNTEKIMEWAGAARDDWHRGDAVGMSRQFVRILAYLDGASYVQQDVPTGTALQLGNLPAAHLGLLQLDPNQNPPGYVYSIGTRMSGILNSAGVTPSQRQLIERANTAVNNVTKWLIQVRQDAKQLILMNNTQLLQPGTLSLLDDMAAQALYAYTGQLDPTTNQVQEGAVQIHYALQALAHFDVTPYQ